MDHFVVWMVAMTIHIIVVVANHPMAFTAMALAAIAFLSGSLYVTRKA